VSADDDVIEPVRCPSCGEENPPSSRFCSSCGSPLTGAATRREERKLVSVLFVDLVGFTSRSDRADPEDVRDTLGLYHAEAKQRIDEHGGTLEKFAGDAVMAVFGVPVAHGDDAERAVRAGLAVLESIDELNSAHGLDLAARAAVNTGDAVVAVGGDGGGEALAIGDVVNTASRLQTAAPEGRLIVGEETHRATRHAIGYEALEAVQAKGKAEALQAWLALEPLGGPAERPMATHPLVGRDRELELMRSFWERAIAERRPHLVTLLAPPGIGKSRLCREVSARVEKDGGQVLRGRCVPYGAQTGYQAFPQIVRGATGIFESDSPEIAIGKLRRALEDLLPAAETPDATRHLALLLGLDVGETAVNPQLLYFAARRFVESTARATATLLIFEDIHWAESSEHELIEYLATFVRDAPIMFIAPARPELLDTRPGWGSGLVAQTTVVLDPLTESDAATLASHLVRAAAEHSFDIARLVEVAEGNPLFLEELAASIAELGDSGTLPVTVREAIASRIDALPKDVRATLLSAAVIGKTFWRDLLGTLGVAEDVDAALSFLEARDFIRREATSQVDGDVEFTFKHVLIQEVAYTTVPRATRRERHAAVARYIEDSIEGASETLAWVLAHHWREAGEGARAIPYLLAAAEAAFRGWAQDSVAHLYDVALELTEDKGLRREIRLQRGIALVRLTDFETAATELGELLTELEGKERLEALLARGRATLWTERHAETVAHAEEAATLASELGDEEAIPATLALQSQGYGQRGEVGDLERALELGDRALAEWVPGARQYDYAEHLHLHADTVYWVGHYERCVELSQEARVAAADVHSAEALMRGGGTEALALAGLGRHEEAIRIWDELFVIAREHGRNLRGLLNYSSLAYREVLDLDEARRRSEEALELSAGESFGMPLRFANSDLLFTDLLAGDVGRAQATWPELWEDAAKAGGWTRWLVYTRLAVGRAEIALHAEGPESAIEWAQKSLELARGTLRRKYEARALSILGEALARAGRREDAIRELQAGVAVSDALINPHGRWNAQAALGRAAYAIGEDDIAAKAYGESAEVVEAFAATLAPERSVRLLKVPAITEILSAAGRPAGAS
jgi:class 3 adenylate cyclase/tetratricopeptide (TPR) repeat protein